jgi:hypothetical protein
MKATGRIQITKVPAGAAPPWVRQEWVGLELPCFPQAGLVVAHSVADRDPKLRDGFIVPQKEAIETLRKKSPEAAQWWNDHGYPNGEEPNFVFGLDEAKVLRGVTFKELIVAGDMETGSFEVPGYR